MSKAVLVLDMPNSCLECELLDYDELTCMGMKVEYDNLNTRQFFCPLKPLPEHKENNFKDGIRRLEDFGHIRELLSASANKGFNLCLDEIIGEQEDEIDSNN